ncbi:type I restriction endonuclease EcoAI subunit S [Marinomonas pontica]|uniref:Type I restriction endonuclease EcoAI subunit S n=1 Tax=Marinomonas pontica TaxID=264739 RepID=A0ABM8F8K9_9GAMM|nr:type I restriction endonuclease EcoAI subunit S [Marinomonas pontica]
MAELHSLQKDFSQEGNVQQLITQHIDLWTGAVKEKSSAGRGGSSKRELYGIKKLRELILELAVRGKLVSQDPSDEPASVLLDLIAAEKAELVKQGKLKKPKKLPEISEDEKPFELPEGWEWARLDSVYDVRDGTHDSPKNIPEGIPLITSKNLSSGTLNFDDVKYISLEDHKKIIERSKVDKYDILFAMIGSIGNPVIVDTDIDFSIKNVALFKYIDLKLSSPVFLQLYLEKMSAELRREASGGVQKFVSLGKLRNCPISLPPLNEQHRIVAKVDELMALCDLLEQQTESSLDDHQTLVQTLLDTLLQSPDAEELEQNWQRLSAHFDLLFTTEQSIDQLKQTILQLAVMGKLVPQDPNDEPASELLKRIAAEKEELVKQKKIKKQKPLPPISDDEKPFQLPKGWEWARVNDIAMFTTSGSRDWAKYYSESGALFVTMGNLSKSSYQLRLDNLRYVNPPQNSEGARTRLEAYDLLISITGEVGNLGLIPEGFGEAYINQHTCLLRFMPEARNRYFPEFMCSQLAKIQFNAPQRGIKNSFRLGDVGEMLVSLPPITEQHRIVAKVDQLMVLCDQLKAKLADSKTTQLNLTDALVAQAV